MDTNGVLTLDSPSNYQTKAAHAFTVRADDGSGNHVDTSLTVNVNVLPVIDLSLIHI